ncbi:hypothetical protein AVEN_166212-1, partial [Araneus ventricosus]
MALKLAEE